MSKSPGHSHDAVRSQGHGFEVREDMFSRPTKEVLQKRTLSKQLHQHDQRASNHPPTPAKLPPQPPGFWTQIKTWMLVFKYVVCSDLAPAAIGVVPIPTSLLLIYPAYGYTSVFPDLPCYLSISFNGQREVWGSTTSPHSSSSQVLSIGPLHIKCQSLFYH